MKNLFFLTILTFLMVGLYSCQKDDIEPDSAIDAYQTQVDGPTALDELVFRGHAPLPFKSVYRVELGEEINPPPLWIVPLYGDGRSRALGNTTWESITTLYDLDFTQDPPWPEGWIQDGDMTFTSPDGSQMFGVFTGFFYGTGGNGTFKIFDGTGKFAGVYTKDNCNCTYYWINNEDAPNYLEFNGVLSK